MGAEEDIALIRSAYAAWNRGDIEEVLAFMSPCVEARPVLGDVVAADTFHGHEGVRRWFRAIRSSLDDFRADVEDIVKTPNGCYLVRLRFSGRGGKSGAPVSLEAAHELAVRDGQLTELTGYPTWEEGLEAARQPRED